MLPLTHLDLENLVVALLAPDSLAWPNPLYALGYRLHHFDASITLLKSVEGGGGRFAPDAIARHPSRNIALILECKSGTDPGFRQIPEGRSDPVESWTGAIAMPRSALGIEPRVHGVLVAEEEWLEPKLAEIHRMKATWLRVPEFTVEPDHLPDDRIATRFAKLPRGTSWPRSFVPFSGDAARDGGLERVIASIGKHILAAAGNGQDVVKAETLARLTHAAVWNVTDRERQTKWTTAVDRALAELASGTMAELAGHDPVIQALRLKTVRGGQRADQRTIAALQKALTAAHRRVQRRRQRVPKQSAGGLQMALFDDDELH